MSTPQLEVATNKKTKLTAGTRSKTKNATPPILTEGPVVWAIDPFEKDRKRSRALLQAIELLGLKTRETMPVTIVAPIRLNWPRDFLPKEQENILEATKRNLARVTRFGYQNTHSATVVIDREDSQVGSIGKLVKLATARGAPLIAVHSHVRRGLERLRLGSFAESLVTLSPLPTLILGPQSQVANDLKSVVFPTDFSPASKKVFRSLIAWASERKCAVVLYHLSTPVSPLAYSGFGLSTDPQWLDDLVKMEHKELRKRAGQWIREAAKHGVTCRFEMETSPQPLGQRLAKSKVMKGAGLLVLGVRKAPWRGTFITTRVREILAMSPLPVLVVKAGRND